MDRRTALKQVAFIMGGTLSMSVVSGVLSGCQATSNPAYVPEFFSPEQYDIVSAIASRIIPKTSTPGAIEVGVPQFIDVMLKDVFKPKEQEAMAEGLAELESKSNAAHSKGFAALTDEEKDELISEIEALAFEQRENGTAKGKPFYMMMRELTLTGYFTSEAGSKEALAFLAIPGKLEGCIPYEEGTKAWAL